MLHVHVRDSTFLDLHISTDTRIPGRSLRRRALCKVSFSHGHSSDQGSAVTNRDASASVLVSMYRGPDPGRFFVVSSSWTCGAPYGTHHGRYAFSIRGFITDEAHTTPRLSDPKNTGHWKGPRLIEHYRTGLVHTQAHVPSIQKVCPFETTTGVRSIGMSNYNGKLAVCGGLTRLMKKAMAMAMWFICPCGFLES
ncbi:hypothetical protein BS17DRAFT_776885 [Gyrodon lividus]|nr:hypothetical protein BS17DRAFT_776885 [Gyrodon lividus]